MPQLTDYLNALGSNDPQARRSAIMSIYKRTDFTRREEHECVDYLEQLTSCIPLGAVYYIFESRESSMMGHLSKRTYDKWMPLYDPSRWENDVWDASDFLMWELARRAHKPHPPKALFIVTEPECLLSFDLFWPVLTGSDSFYKIGDECGNSFLMRSSFSAEEVDLAKRIILAQSLNARISMYSAHVLMETLEPSEIATWGESHFREKRFQKDWSKLMDNRHYDLNVLKKLELSQDWTLHEEHPSLIRLRHH